MKLSIEATDKLKNKDFHYELTSLKNIYRHGLWYRASQSSPGRMVEEKIKSLKHGH
ncbi:MAG: hypothetical protein ACLRZE_00500 [Streptococcus salivarius]